MEILGKYLTLIDSFGVPIQLHTQSGSTLFKSSVGGLSTVILYTLSLMYFIFVITEWQLGNIAPKISAMLKTPGIIKVDLEQNFLNLGLFNQSTDSIDPFRQFDNIITPFIIYVDDMSVIQPKPIFSQLMNVNYAIEPKNQISFDALTLVQYTGEHFEQNKDLKSKQFFLVFKTCDTSFIQGNYTCASPEVISNYIDNFRGVIDINTQLQQYNPQKGTTDKIVKTQYFVIDNQIPTFSQILLSTTNEIQNKGLLFDAFKSQVIIHNAEFTIQPITKEFTKEYFGFEVLSSIIVSLNPIQTEETIVDPKLGEVLAQVGSLFSLLLTVKFAIQYYNLWRLNQEIFESVISQVYPKYKQLTIRRDIIGRIQNVKYNSLQIDIKKFNKKYNDIKDIIQEKLKVTTIIQTLLKERDKQIESNNIIKTSKIYPINDDQDNHSGRSSMQNEDFDMNIIFSQTPFQYIQ